MITSNDIKNELDNLLLSKLSGEEMSEFRNLLEKFEKLVFQEGRDDMMDCPDDKEEDG